MQHALWMIEVRNPLLATGHLSSRLPLIAARCAAGLDAGRREHRADILSVEQTYDDIFHPRFGNVRTFTDGQHHVGGVEFGHHPAGAERTALPPDVRANVIRHRPDACDACSAVACQGIQKSIGVREQHERIGVQQCRDQRRERVVVADANFVDGHRIILVDDRNQTCAQQSIERIPRIDMPHTRTEIIMRQQNLRHPDAMLRELLTILFDQTRLPRRRGRLEPGQIGGTSRQPEIRKPRRDRSRRHAHHIDAPRMQNRHLFGVPPELHMVDPPRRRHQRAAADLDHHARPSMFIRRRGSDRISWRNVIHAGYYFMYNVS